MNRSSGLAVRSKWRFPIRAASAVDQGLSSLSNLLLALLVARFASVADFGLFAIWTGLYWLMLGAGRAIMGEPGLVVRDRNSALSAAHKAYASLVLGLIAAGAFIVAGAVTESRLFTVTAIGLVPLLLQDTLRYHVFAREQPLGAVVLDAVWLAVQLLTVPIVLTWLEPRDPSAWVAAWCVGASVSAVLGLCWIRPAWSATGMRAWFDRTKRLASGFLSDYAITTGVQQGTLLLVPLVSSLGVVAALKTAQVVNGPVNVMMNAAALTLLPTIARQRESGAISGAIRSARTLSLSLLAISIIYMGILMLILPHWGEALLGESQWQNSRDVIPLFCLHMGLVGVIQGAVLALRGLAEVKSLLVTRLTVTPINVCVPLLGAALGGATGMAWGMISSAGITAVMWWATVRRVGRDAREKGAGAL